MSYVAKNGTVPDQWAWHMETGGGNMIEANQGLNDLLSAYKLPAKGIVLDFIEQ